MSQEFYTTPQSIDEARNVQQSLRPRVSVHNHFEKLETVAGIDVGYDNAHGLAHASIVVMKLASLKMYADAQAYVPVAFPYVPGFLSFREIPAILAALAQLQELPDLLMVDGQGIAHPKRLGIASHLGVLLDKPSIGVAKSRLIGDYHSPGMQKGDTSPLTHGGERVGTVLRSKDNTNPLFISPGHRVDADTALLITLQCLTRYRLPEPTRLADKLSKCKPQAQPSLIAS